MPGAPDFAACDEPRPRSLAARGQQPLTSRTTPRAARFTPKWTGVVRASPGRPTRRGTGDKFPVERSAELGADHKEPLGARSKPSTSIRHPARSGSSGARQPAVQRADDLLVLADRFAVGAVPQPIDDPPDFAALALGREPQRGEGAAHCLLSPRAAPVERELSTELSSGALDLAQASWTRRGAAGQPARELLVGVGWLPAGEGVGRDRPAVTRSTARLQRSLARDESRGLQPFEMDPHTTRVKGQLRG